MRIVLADLKDFSPGAYHSSLLKIFPSISYGGAIFLFYDKTAFIDIGTATFYKGKEDDMRTFPPELFRVAYGCELSPITILQENRAYGKNFNVEAMIKQITVSRIEYLTRNIPFGMFLFRRQGPLMSAHFLNAGGIPPSIALNDAKKGLEIRQNMVRRTDSTRMKM